MWSSSSSIPRCVPCLLGLEEGSLRVLATADTLPQLDVLEPHGMEALDRAEQVLGLAEGPHPGELERDPYRLYAPLVRPSLPYSASSLTSDPGST